MEFVSESGEAHYLGLSLAALLPIALLVIAFMVYCWIDIARHSVRHLPKWAWAIICCATVPLGGILYLTLGRDSGDS